MVNLVSIDTRTGLLRAYMSVEGNRPKRVSSVTLKDFTPDVGLGEFSGAIEKLRREPLRFEPAAGGEAA